MVAVYISAYLECILLALLPYCPRSYIMLACWKKFVVATLASTLVVAAVSLNSLGQDAKKADPKAKAGAKEKPKGRLPAYYKDVVTDEQREQIYAVQAKYAKQLEDLQSQIDGVKAKQNEEIEGLLSAEQKEKLAKVKAEADAKKKSAKKDDGDKTTAPRRAGQNDREPEEVEVAGWHAHGFAWA